MSITIRNKRNFKNVTATINNGEVTVIEKRAEYLTDASCTIDTAVNGMLLTFYYGDETPTQKRVLTDTWSLRDAIEEHLMKDVEYEIPFVPEHYSEEDLETLRAAGANIPTPSIAA